MTVPRAEQGQEYLRARARAYAEHRARTEFQHNLGRMSFPDAKRILDEALRSLASTEEPSRGSSGVRRALG